jgi:hypothetical protein
LLTVSLRCLVRNSSMLVISMFACKAADIHRGARKRGGVADRGAGAAGSDPGRWAKVTRNSRLISPHSGKGVSPRRRTPAGRRHTGSRRSPGVGGGEHRKPQRHQADNSVDSVTALEWWGKSPNPMGSEACSCIITTEKSVFLSCMKFMQLSIKQTEVLLE